MNQEQFETLIRVDCNVKALMKSRDELKAENEARDKRIAVLEKDKHKQLGALAVITVAVTSAWQWWLGTK